MSNVPGMVYRCHNDLDRTMEFVSEGGKHLTGYPAEGLVEGNVKFASLIHADDRQLVWQEIQSAVEAQIPFELTYRIHTATGEEKWVWEHGRDVTGDDGKGKTLEGLILDIGEQRQTELALRALAGTTAVGDSEDFVSNCTRELARTYEAWYALIGVFEDGQHNSIRTLAVWAGDTFCENFSYDLKGTPCSDVLNCRSDIIPRGAMNRFPEDQLLKDLQVESYYGAPLINSAGETLGLVVVMDTKPMQPNVWTRPILGIFANRIALELERQQAEDQLRQSEAYMRLTLETAPIGIASADLQGLLLDVNPAFAGLLGYTPDELVEKTIKDLTHPRDREETDRHFEALIQGDISRYELEKRYLRRDGGVLHVRAQAGLVRDAEGRPMRVVEEVVDETDRLKAAREIQLMRTYLKNIIDSMPSVLVGVDTKGRVTEWNRSAERITGVMATAGHWQRRRGSVPTIGGTACQYQRSDSSPQADPYRTPAVQSGWRDPLCGGHDLSLVVQRRHGGGYSHGRHYRTHPYRADDGADREDAFGRRSGGGYGPRDQQSPEHHHAERPECAAPRV